MIKKNGLSLPNKKQWQIIGSCIILFAAIAIVFPILLNFAIGLGRLAITIAIILLATLVISRLQVKYKLKKLKQNTQKPEEH